MSARATALALALVAAPAAAQQMTQGDCAAALATVSEMLRGTTGTELPPVRQTVTADGWCRVDASQPALDGAKFATLDWRADGIDAYVADQVPPTALAVRATGLHAMARPDGPLFDASLVLRQEPSARQLLVEELRVTSDMGDDLHLTAVFDRVDFSSWSMAQVSLGAMLLSRVNIRANLGAFAELGIWDGMSVEMRGDPETLRDSLRRRIEALPDTVLAPGAEDHIAALIADLPAPRGKLEIGLSADPGLGLVQFALYGRSLHTSLDKAPVPLLRGVTLDVIWDPE